MTQSKKQNSTTILCHRSRTEEIKDDCNTIISYIARNSLNTIPRTPYKINKENKDKIKGYKVTGTNFS